MRDAKPGKKHYACITIGIGDFTKSHERISAMARLSSAAAQAARAKMAALDETLETDSESGDSKSDDQVTMGPRTKDSDGDSEDTPFFDSEVAIECLLDDCGSAYEPDTVTLYIHGLCLTIKQVKHLREACLLDARDRRTLHQGYSGGAMQR